jgi:hypothetical protein
MPVELEQVIGNMSTVSDKYQFQLSQKKPGAYLGLQGLEAAFAGLLTFQKFNHLDGTPDEINKALSDALSHTYTIGVVPS